MEAVQIPIKKKWRYRPASGHKSTHNTGRIGPKIKLKHGYWTSPTQWGYFLSGGRRPATVQQKARVLITACA